MTAVLIQQLSLGAIDPHDSFDRALRYPIEHLYSSGQLGEIVIVLDGLDEILALPTGDQIVNWISTFTLGKPPTGCRFILTYRNDQRLIRRLGSGDVDLVHDDATQGRDIEMYSESFLPDSLTSTQKKDLAKAISSAAKGIFLYAYYVVQELGAMTEESLRHHLESWKLPADLQSLYADFLTRELGRSDEAWEDDFRPILAALSLAHAPGLTAEEIALSARITPSKVDDRLKRCSQYLVLTNERWSIWHLSFSEFLLSPGYYYVYPSEAQARLAEAFIGIAESTDLSSSRCWYALRWGLAHAISSKDADLLARASAIGSTWNYIVSKLRISAFVDLLNELEALSCDSELARCSIVAELLLSEGSSLQMGMDGALGDVFILQQIRNVAARTGNNDLVAELDALLARSGKPYLRWNWSYATPVRPLRVSPSFGATLDVRAVPDPSANRVWVAAGRALSSWSLEEREYGLRTFIEEPDGVAAIAVSPDGRFVATGSGDVFLVDATTGDVLIHIQEANTGYLPAALAFVGNDSICVGLANGNIAKYGLAASLQLPLEASIGLGPVVCMEWNQPSGVLVAGTKKGHVVLLDSQLTPMKTKKKHKKYVSSVAVARNAPIAISGSFDETVKVWSLLSGECTGTLRGHTACVGVVSVTADGRYGVSATGNGRVAVKRGKESDGTIRIWDLGSMECVATIDVAHHPIYEMWLSDQTSSCFIAQGGIVREFDIPSGRELSTLLPSSPASSVAACGDGSLIAVGCQDGRIRSWRLDAVRGSNTLAVDRAAKEVRLSSDGGLMLITCNDRKVLIECESGAEVGELALNAVASPSLRRAARALKIPNEIGGVLIEVWDPTEPGASKQVHLGAIAGKQLWGISSDGVRLLVESDDALLILELDDLNIRNRLSQVPELGTVRVTDELDSVLVVPEDRSLQALWCPGRHMVLYLGDTKCSFSRDGRWLCQTTQLGARVYDLSDEPTVSWEVGEDATGMMPSVTIGRTGQVLGVFQWANFFVVRADDRENSYALGADTWRGGMSSSTVGDEPKAQFLGPIVDAEWVDSDDTIVAVLHDDGLMALWSVNSSKSCFAWADGGSMVTTWLKGNEMGVVVLSGSGEVSHLTLLGYDG
ncbi:hypothetical protein [Terrabacter sp. Soil810]|uniref:hypothetical protein n=1 Tax=Terrabacter sp. Soil810 TaxID=1736418 RepID=UPI001F26AB55|nr:hypothetical protein [Terrabacter sp. Soil810]